MQTPSTTLPAVTPGSALFLDFDGTLAELAPQPDAVHIPGGLVPTLAALHDALGGAVAIVTGRRIDERELDRVQAIITSMTAWERRHPEAIKGSRRLRIARGSGTSVQQVNRLVKQFGEMRKMMKGLASGKMPDLGAMMRQR